MANRDARDADIERDRGEGQVDTAQTAGHARGSADDDVTPVCRGPVANFSRPVCELHEKAAWPNFWLQTGLPDGRISIHSCVDSGSEERNFLTNRAQKNFATGPDKRSTLSFTRP